MTDLVDVVERKIDDGIGGTQEPGK